MWPFNKFGSVFAMAMAQHHSNLEGPVFNPKDLTYEIEVSKAGTPRSGIT